MNYMAETELKLLCSYVNRYIEDQYLELSLKFRVLDCTINEKAVSSLDKLNDTILSLYETDKTFKSYEEFYKWADNKFTPKKDREMNKRHVDGVINLCIKKDVKAICVSEIK